MGDPLDGIVPKGLRALLDLEQRLIGPQQKLLGTSPLIADIERQQKMLGNAGMVKALDVARVATPGVMNAHEFYERTIGIKSVLGGALAEMTARQERFSALIDRVMGRSMFDAISSNALRMNHFPDNGILRAAELARPLFASHTLAGTSFMLTTLRDAEFAGLSSSRAADAALDVFALRYEPTDDDADAIRVEVTCSFCQDELGLEQVVYGNLPARRLGLVLCDTCLGYAESDPEKFVVMLGHARRIRAIPDVIDGEGCGDGVRIGVLRIVECTSEDDNDND